MKSKWWILTVAVYFGNVFNYLKLGYIVWSNEMIYTDLKNINTDRTISSWFMVISVTFNNISVISWQSVLLSEETRGPGENHRPVASHWQNWLQNVVTFSRHKTENRRNRRKIGTVPLTHIHDHSLSWLGTITLILAGLSYFYEPKPLFLFKWCGHASV